MKKTVFIFTVVVAFLAIYSFTTIDKYPDYVSGNSVTMFKSQYIKTINNNDLNIQLEQNFSNLFDKVTFVDAQFSKESGYYYIVFGEINKAKTIQLLKIEKEDIFNETYTYIDFTNIEVNEFLLYCHKPLSPSICSPQCLYYGGVEECDLSICGIWTGSQCIPR